MRRLVLLLVFAAAARADHPPDWLKLPGAAERPPAGVSAWVLDMEERVSQETAGSVTYRYRFAVQVVTKAGVNHAGFGIPFTAGCGSVAFSKAWAMSPDGVKCRQFGGDEFVVGSATVSNWVWDQSKVVSFSAERYLQPGWVFACEVEIKEDSSPFDVHWNPRLSIPVRSSTFEMVPMEGGSVKWRAFSKDLPGPEARPNGAMLWTVRDVPPYDVNVPPDMEPNSMDLRAYLLTRPAENKSWGDVVRLARAEIEPKTVSTPAIAALAKEKQGSGGLWARILPVCGFVQKEVTYLAVTIDTDVMAGYRPHLAEEVCDSRSGDCKDKAVLLCTMLRSLGVDSNIMIVNAGAPRVNVVDWPSAYFNHAIVAIPCAEAPPANAPVVSAGGRDYLLFDPTDDQVPFGLLPLHDMGGEGLILASGMESTVTIPTFAPEFVTYSSEVKTVLAADGSGTVDVSEKRFGLVAAEAIARDETRPLAERTGDLERRIQRRVPLVSDLVWDSKGDESLHDWSSTAHFSAQYIGKRMTGGMYVATDLMSVVPNPRPWDDKGDGWVTITPGTLRRTIELDAPAGWDFEEFPPDWSMKSPAGEGSMRYWRDGGVAKGEVELTVRGGVLDREAYLTLCDLMHSANAAERRPVLLRRNKPPAAAATPAAAAAH